MFDFTKRHPYLTFLITAAFTNLFVFTFFPLEIITALIITAAVFATYGVSMLIVQFFNWAFFPTEEVPTRHHRADLAADNIYVKGIHSGAEKELSPEALEELVALTDKLEILIPKLTEESITFSTYTAPVIANDLFFYDYTDESYRELVRQGKPSAYTREPFLSNSFPFSHVKLKALCDAISNPLNTVEQTLQKLLPLAICPVTKEIMKDPKIVHLIYTYQRHIPHTFVLVCDQAALKILPPFIKLATKNIYIEKSDGTRESREVERRRDWNELKTITNDDLIGPKLQRALNAASIRKETDSARAWEAAYTQAQKDFPSLNPEPSQYSSNPQSFHYASPAANSYYSPPGAAASSFPYRY